MNKKLYFLNEDEKNRILNLHESATKKQYLLGEQTSLSMLQPITQMFSEPTEKKAKFWYNADRRAKKLDKICKNKGTDSKENQNIKPFINWLITTQTSNRGGSEKLNAWSQIPDILSKVQTLNNFCSIKPTLLNLVGNDDIKKEVSNKGVALWLKENISSEKSWIKYFEEPLESVLKEAGLDTLNSGKKSNQAKPEQTQRPIGWDNYPCVVKKGGKDITLTYKGIKSNWKKLVGTNNKTYYYNDKGQYYVKGQNILGNYECGYDGGIYRLGESPKKPEISYDKKNWYVTNKKYSDEIKSALNLDPKTMLSDKDIETIYNKLVEKGMIK